ncbi:de-hypoxanthine futalosine cyclase [Geoglobus ahangari]|uniref:De-hypoxanthine futalosine cyclase n=1 Tax=Geoglobus ahangari TaxID=113653 RepID=A0A0F7DBW5_9EURY|nr:CofH family radical SAM protein [Geoglobus ahangari]AKG91801.1 de-hypoxanthine futalosine cyclase [Geoglobus ahangari]
MNVREIEALFEENLHELGKRADSLNRGIATFSINKHINYTNVCVSKCPICAYYRTEGYVMSVDEVVDSALSAVSLGAKELHIVGSHNPEIGVEYFEEIFRRIKERAGNGVVIKALTATEVSYYARKEGMSVREFLSRLRDAGLDMMPGGGAEILVERVRKRISPHKADSREWLRVMEIAHSLGIRSNATMLFGHVESYRDRAVHLYRIWRLQEKTGGFLSFIPLVFHPENTSFSHLSKASPQDVLKTIAVSRIVLSNFRGIKAYWVMLGEKLAQVALNYGANDVDGTVMGERIAHSAGAKTPLEMAKERLVELLRGAGKTPAERDAYFNVLEVYE